MGLYSDLSDEELAAKIVKYRDAIEEATLGGGVGVIAGEGRRMEITKADVGRATTILEALIFERDTRANDGIPCGRALGVRFTR